MSEHLTRNTLDGVLKFCPTCGQLAKHYVSDGRIGRCMEHNAQQETKRQKAARKKREREEKQGSLFVVK